ncbi:DNA repair protein RadC, partial [Candidatus Sumerlaeota bacterium]|nr:DNA repair protein RadC [Candidatus Sumerlaeota bacterium]
AQNKRTLRALTRLFMSDEEKRESPANSDPGLAPLLKKYPRLRADARIAIEKLKTLKANAEGIHPGGAPMNLAGEAAMWAKSLPGLGGLKAWRMLAHLDRPVIVPDSPIRTFFWRLGMIESRQPGDADAARAAACIEKTLQLTGLPVDELRLLIAWHTGPLRGYEGGNRCGKKPDCAECPFAPGCLWARFRERGVPPARRDNPAAPESDSSSGIDSVKERFDSQGAESLADAELLALFLQSTSEGGALKLADLLLQKFDGIKGMMAAAPAEFKGIKGVGEARARQIQAALELGRRLAENPLRPGDPVDCSNDIWLAYRSRYRHTPQEHLILILLDTRNRVIEAKLVSKGTLSGSPAHPREVFKRAVQQSASGVILMHNHPSGDPTPSSDDFAVTKQLAEAGRILGIRVLDHIILGDKTYYSFKDEGKM